MTDFALGATQRRRGIAIMIAMAAVVGVILGLSWALLTLVLESQGVSPTMIGFSTASQFLSVFIILPLVPWFMTRFGTVQLIWLAIAVILITLVLLPAFPNVYAWFPIRFFLGAGIETLLFACDIWINQAAEDRTRGRVISVYTFALGAGLAAGPLIINVTGIEGWTPFLVGAAIVALAVVPLAWSRGLALPVEGRPSGRLGYFLRIAPVLMLAGLMYGLVESVALTFLPIYGLGFGFDESAVTMMLSVLIIGSVVAQLPIGWLCDHIGGRLMLIGCTLFALIPGAMLPFIIDVPLALWPTLFIWGGAIGGFLTISMVILGRRFQGVDLAAANVAFVVLWGVGTITGPMTTGAAMDAWGLNAMPAVVVVACLLYLSFTIARLIRGGRE